MKLIGLIFSLTAATMLASCSKSGVKVGEIKASDNMTTWTVDARNFDEIEASIVRVVYTQGSPISVNVTAPDNVAEYVTVKVKDGKLEAGIKSNILGSITWDDNNRPTVYVTAPSVKDFEASASAVITVECPLTVSSADFEATSSAVINLASISGDKVEMDATASGVISVDSVLCREVDLDASSNGTLNVQLVKSSRTEISASSSAVICLSQNISDLLDVEASSSAVLKIESANVITSSVDATSGAQTDIAIEARKVMATVTSGAIATFTGHTYDADITTNSGGQVVTTGFIVDNK